MFSNPSWNFILHLVISGLHVAKNQVNFFLQKTNCITVVAFDEAQNTFNMLNGHKTDEKISELFARAQIIADTMEVVLQPMRREGRQVHRDNPNVNSDRIYLVTTIAIMNFQFLC
jgi:hypothetical protein